MKKKITIAAIVLAAMVGIGTSISAVLPIFASQTYEEKLAAYNKAMEQYQKDLTAYNNSVKECEDKKAEYQTKLTAYNTAKAQYDKDYAQYQKDLADYLANINKDGYVNLDKGQGLVFVDESNATITNVTGNGQYYNGTDEGWAGAHSNIGRTKTYLSSKDVSSTPKVITVKSPWIVGGGMADNGSTVQALPVTLTTGESVTVTHKVNNTTLNGTKVATVVRTWTLKSSPAVDFSSTALIFADPTLGIYFGADRTKADGGTSLASTWWTVSTKYLDASGKEISNESNDSRGYVGISSLNHTLNGAGGVIGEIEAVRTTGKAYIINGSSIQKFTALDGYQDYAPGTMYASNSSNHSTTEGSKYNRSEWDGSSSTHPLSYYGAIVLENSADIMIENNPMLVGGSNPRKGQRQWTQISSDLFSVSRPVPPKEPTKPEEPNCTPPQRPTPPTKPDEPMCNIRVRYIDEDGNDLTPPANVFGSEQKCGTDYKTDKKTFDGYEFKEMHKDSNDPNGKLEEGGNKDVIYVYTKIKMCNINVRHVDINGKDLTPTVKVFSEDQRCGTEYKTEKKDFKGYVFKEMHKDSNSPNGKLEEGGNKDVIYVYAPLCNIKVRYIDNQGNELYPTKNVFEEPKECGEDYTTEKKEFPGYRFEKMHDDSCDANGKLQDGSDCEVIYVYVPICNIRVKHVDVNGNELIPSKNVFEEDQDCGTPYETKKEEIPGYTFKEMHSDSCDPNGTLEKDSDCEVIYVYVPVCNIKVKHIDVYGNTLIDSKNVYDEDKECGDPYETKREDIPGYRFVRIHPDSCEPNGKLGEKDCEVIYVYEKIEAPDTGFRADQMPLYVLIGGSILTIIGYGVFRKR